MRNLLKLVLFNTVFWIYTAFCCFVLTFSFVLPRKAAFRFVRWLYFCGIVWVERIFLGLDYRVTGWENLPKDQSYILAVKHYSIYETLKVPVIFGDIAIILKRELTWIPFWGWYTLKTGMIPVDRGGRNKAIISLIKGARRVIAQKRPILIFPQGTRVMPWETAADKPYKVGIGKIAEALKLPVVPVALNTGAFWPKKSFTKRAGVVYFQILPAIPPGLPAPELIKRIEDVLEPASAALMAKPDYTTRTRASRLWGFKPWLAALLAIFVAWAAWWHVAAYAIEREFAVIPPNVTSPQKPTITGFPGRMMIEWRDVTYAAPSATMTLARAYVLLWPLPLTNAMIAAPDGATLQAQHNGAPLNVQINQFLAVTRLPLLGAPQLKSVMLTALQSQLMADGAVDVPVDGGAVNGTMSVTLLGYQAFVSWLETNDFIDQSRARAALAVLDAVALTQGTDEVRVPMTIKDDAVYISALKVFDLGDLRPPVAGSGLPPQRNPSDGSATDAVPATGQQNVPPLVLPE